MMTMMTYSMLLALSVVCMIQQGYAVSEPIHIHCSDGWSLYPGGQTCYKFMPQRKRWFDAQVICREFPHGDLAVINDEGAARTVKGLLGKRIKAWIGLNDMNRERHYKWFNNMENATYHKVDPDTNNDDKDCGNLRTDDGLTMKWEMDGCYSGWAFVCQRPASGIPVPHPPAVLQQVCREGWTRYEGGVGCIKIFDTPKQWLEAKAICTQYNSHLLTIPNYVANNFIGKITKNANYWTGIHDRCSEGTFVNDVNNEPIVYQTWAGREPNTGHTADNEDCVLIAAAGTYKWYDQLCSTGARFICQYGEPRKSLSCASGWKALSDASVCVQKNTGSVKSWKGARKVCKAKGGDLVAIKNQKDFDIVKGLAKADEKLWIGLKKTKAKNGKWQWAADKSDSSFTKWASKQPSNKAKELCVEMNLKKAGGWNDKECNARRDFVCQKPAEETTSY